MHKLIIAIILLGTTTAHAAYKDRHNDPAPKRHVWSPSQSDPDARGRFGRVNGRTTIIHDRSAFDKKINHIPRASHANGRRRK